MCQSLKRAGISCSMGLFRQDLGVCSLDPWRSDSRERQNYLHVSTMREDERDVGFSLFCESRPSKECECACGEGPVILQELSRRKTSGRACLAKQGKHQWGNFSAPSSEKGTYPPSPAYTSCLLQGHLACLQKRLSGGRAGSVEVGAGQEVLFCSYYTTALLVLKKQPERCGGWGALEGEPMEQDHSIPDFPLQLWLYDCWLTAAALEEEEDWGWGLGNGLAEAAGKAGCAPPSAVHCLSQSSIWIRYIGQFCGWTSPEHFLGAGKVWCMAAQQLFYIFIFVFTPRPSWQSLLLLLCTCSRTRQQRPEEVE